MISLLDSLKHAAGVGTAPTEGWTAKRKPLTERDRVLVSQTHFWLRQIPGPYQPKQLCRHYPRVANEIARSWDDRVVVDRLLIDLKVDKRGGRAGFPARILQELRVLQALRERRAQTAGGIAIRLRKILNTPIRIG